MFAVSGMLFAGGTLLLARTMPVEAFGRFALGVALFNLFSLVAPMGLDQLLLRARLAIGWRLARLVTSLGVGLGALVAAGAMWSGGLSTADATLAGLSVAAGGLSVTVAGALRAAGRAREAVPYTTGANWMIFAIGLISLASPFASATMPLTLFLAGNLLRAAVGWRLLFRAIPTKEPTVAIDWRVALSLAGIAAVGTAMLQMERLLIPAALDMADLALFAVVSSTVMFPFRLLNQAAGFALTPRLAAERGAGARVELVRAEAVLMGALAFAATAIVLAVAAPIAGWITSGAYRISEALVAAGCANGLVKLLYALTRSVVTACGTRAQVGRLNGLGVGWLVLATAGGAAGARWGLTGLLLGVAAGGLVTVLPLGALARASLRDCD